MNVWVSDTSDFIDQTWVSDKTPNGRVIGGYSLELGFFVLFCFCFFSNDSVA